ncbi:hypothetical protein HDV05_001464 [Chytridiales sp. JEL 0842]|nr:hypothetical protein HDV05_001464 [Chytridiales sp. JEL 0842]
MTPPYSSEHPDPALDIPAPEMTQGPIGMDANEFRRRGHETVERIARYYEELEKYKVLSTVQPGYLSKLVPSEAPEEPENFDAITADFESKIMPGITHWQHPNFFAFFPANSSFPGILADMYSDMINCIGFNWEASPACTELETIVLDWMSKAIGLPSSFLSSGAGGGSIQGTASEAVAVAVIAARQRALDTQRANGMSEAELDAYSTKLIAYASSQTHSCTKKATMIANVKFRVLDVDENLRLRGETVKKAMEEDIAKGLVPFFVTVTLGSTSAGVVDAIPEVTQAVKDTLVWIHVDAAWAGSALVCEEYRHHLAGVENCDSFDFNVHKWLLTNFDCSLMWVKQRKYLTNALSLTPVYLRNEKTDAHLVTDYKDWQLPLGRRFRALKIWFVVRTYGLKGLRAHIRKSINQGHLFHSLLLQNHTLFKPITGPNFSLVTFQVLPPTPNSSLEEINQLTNEVHKEINKDGEIYLTHTAFKGLDVIRFVTGSPQTEERHKPNSVPLMSDDSELWVFGYGSLIWKVDFPYEKRIVGYITASHRRFWQGSHDHRGTQHAPGRVVTLIPDEEFREKWAKLDETMVKLGAEGAERCWGVVYKVFPEDIPSVKAHLDHREKNGYETLKVEVLRDDVEGRVLVKGATIYVASTDNHAFLGPRSVKEMATQILESQGASGRNLDYFLNLCRAVRVISSNHPDNHLAILESEVRRLAKPNDILDHNDDRDMDDLKALVDAGKEGLRVPVGKEGWAGVGKGDHRH